MYVEHLQLGDFRSYRGVDVPLQPGVTIFVGANGQGKTNLVEAIEYLSTLSSHRVASEVPLVRAGTERAIVRARVRAGIDDDRVLQLEIEITPGKSNRAKLNRSPLPRPRELLGILRTVVFSPEDLTIVKGDPSDRRRFLDELVVTRWPRMAGVRADYDRVLRQRNTLLKSVSGRRGGAPAHGDVATTLDVWDDQLARHGGELLAARLDTLHALMPHVAECYAEIAPTNNVATASYKTALDLPDSAAGPEPVSRDDCITVLRQAMTDRRSEEMQRGVSLVGPHRDDVTLALGELPAKGYASHGESWSYALALKLGSFHLLRADGVEPVLVLDDVFAELDATRRERLARGVLVAEQVLVTAAVGSEVPDLLQGVRFTVRAGEVSSDDVDTGSEPGADAGIDGPTDPGDGGVGAD